MRTINTKVVAQVVGIEKSTINPVCIIKPLSIPLSQPQLECSVWRSFWPWRTSWRKTWSSYSPHIPAKTQCFHRWTLTSRRPGISSCHLNRKMGKWAAVSQCWRRILTMKLEYGTTYLIHLHLDERSLSSDCDHWDISSKQSLQKRGAVSLTYATSMSTV